MKPTTYDRPALFLVFGTYALCVLVAFFLTSCTVSKPAPYTATVGQHEHSHDHRTKQQEPAPSHIR